MPIVRWEPMRLSPWWRHWPRIFDEDWDWLEPTAKGMNVYETKDNVVVEAAVPGVPAEKVDVSIEGDVISIRAELEEKTEDEKKKTYFRKMEKRSFHYVTTLPRPVKSDRAEAEVKDGMVVVTIPKAEEAKAKRIKVQAKSK